MFGIDALKALAILLVTHSHTSTFYPAPVVATGGLLGNCLFFFSSSFLITLGLAQRPERFISWYSRRLRRIYLPLWIMVCLLAAAGLTGATDTAGLISYALFPRDFWFLPVIALLYIPCYAIIRWAAPFLIKMILVGALTAYVVASLFVVDPHRWTIENGVVFKSLFYFAVMVAGIYVARTQGSMWLPTFGIRTTAMLTLAFFAYLALLELSGLFILQVGANLLALAWTLSVNDTLRSPVMIARLKRAVPRTIAFLSALTLQIYLVQVPLIEHGRVEDLPFPVNVATLWALLLTLAWLFSKLIQLVDRRIDLWIASISDH